MPAIAVGLLTFNLRLSILTFYGALVVRSLSTLSRVIDGGFTRAVPTAVP